MYVNEKIIPAETVPGIRGWERCGERELKYDIFNTL
jgi:hypothetical protein